MAFNLKRKKLALSPIPPMGDVAYNPDNPMRISWDMAAAKMLPQYQAQDPSITDIQAAMARLGKSPEEVMAEARAVSTESLGKQENAVNIQDQITTQIQNAIASKPFNLKTAKIKNAQGMDMQPPVDPMGLNDSPEMMGDPLEQQDAMQQEIPQPPFINVGDFMKWADNTETGVVLQAVMGDTGRGDHLKEGMERYYSSQDEGAKAIAAAEIFDDEFFPLREGTEVMGIPKHFGQVDAAIKKVARTTAKKHKAKVFNLKKTAQHKSLDNAILWGPEQSQIDPFLKQPVSDWHIVERNKGFGLVVDDVWNIDYETIWRENIMDKYSRPYKNKEGEWVGGYLNKRFEIDRNIPPENNMQLKPGQLRKPILPEYGNTESRLQAARAAGDIEGAIDKSKPFNWKEAQTKKRAWNEPDPMRSPEPMGAPDPLVPAEPDDFMKEILSDPTKAHELANLGNLIKKKQSIPPDSPEYSSLIQEIASLSEEIFGTGNPLHSLASKKKS